MIRYFLLFCLALPLLPAHAGGEHDFDWEIGTWNTKLKRLAHPLSGSQEWTLNFANGKAGQMTSPNSGEFKNGRGEFYQTDTFGPRTILVRFIISGVTATSAHFEQAFSEDGGKTWEINWIADDTRIN